MSAIIEPIFLIRPTQLAVSSAPLSAGKSKTMTIAAIKSANIRPIMASIGVPSWPLKVFTFICRVL